MNYGAVLKSSPNHRVSEVAVLLYITDSLCGLWLGKSTSHKVILLSLFSRSELTRRSDVEGNVHIYEHKNSKCTWTRCRVSKGEATIVSFIDHRTELHVFEVFASDKWTRSA